jgi:hypothetical protein
MAVASLICALSGLLASVPSMIVTLDSTGLSLPPSIALASSVLSLLAMLAAFCLGVAGLAVISSSGGRVTGYGFGAIGTAIPVIQVFAFCCLTCARWGPTVSPRMRCGTNLSGLGKAMLIYADDYDNTLPLAGGPRSRWAARLPWWAADNREDAYGLSDPNATEATASISASLYLLIKHAEVTPKSFVCPRDSGTSEFKPGKYGLSDEKLIDLWDFGPDPPMHCSYAYHMVYGGHKITIWHKPSVALLADRNPWINSPFRKTKDFSLFRPDVAPFNGSAEQARHGNAAAHNGAGQNVLFLDSHVEFTRRPFRKRKLYSEGVGRHATADDDNIYTSWDGQDKIRGIPPKLGSQPADPLDSLLVNDPAIPQ